MSAPSTPAEDADKGRHYAFIKDTLSDPFKNASVRRGQSLAAAKLKIEPWYATAADAHHDKLKAANLKAWTSQNQVDEHLKDLQDVHSFAAPLLQKKLKDEYGVEDDVKTTYLRLYMPKELPWYARENLPGFSSRTVSLLDAALHNFAKSEQAHANSQYITHPDERQHFDVVPIKDKMSIQQFQTLCRELDIGALYKQHLDSHLLSDEPVVKAVLEQKVVTSQKDALAVAAQLALTTGNLQYDAYKLILALIEGKPELLLNGKTMGCGGLSMMATELTGIMLVAPMKLDAKGIGRIIVYVPHDPDHPLKEYESPNAFMTELARQLREDKVGASTQQSYRQFFSQFVDHQQRGHFFAELESRLFETKHHTKDDPTDQRPTWRKEPRTNPHLQFERLSVPVDYWKHAYQQQLNKILNDARVIAVSTADTDTKERWAWWDNFKKIVSDIFNVALLVATPFVPGLGELMMAYTVYQLTSDVIEGLVDLAEGLGQQAAEHVFSVVTDVIQLVAFKAGTDIGELFRLKVSQLVEGMKPVKLADGRKTLWHPDLEPYQQKNLTLATDARPDEQGLHRHADQNILRLEGKLYAVEKASKQPTSRTHRVKHPSRPNAYWPKVEHNGSGAWVHEAENPANWEGATLMQRLGHSVDRFETIELEHIRISSGTQEDALRRMYVENAPTPPLLADTIKRFRAYDEVKLASANIRTGRAIDATSVWFEPILTGLPGWPAERAVKVYEKADLTGSSRTYGNANATAADTLSISIADITSGQLPDRTVAFLNDAELATLLGRDAPAAERVQLLRNLLADTVEERQGEISLRIYQATERSDKAQVHLLKQTFPDIPLALTEKVLSNAKSDELKIMNDENRLPLRMKTQARELDFEAGAARAYDGFYRDQSVVPDTERLALKTLRLYTDTFADLRIETRDGTHDGTLRCGVGAENASTVRRLIRNEHGLYEVLDGDNKQLHKAGDFYEAILRSLPEEKRAQLGYQHGQGSLLKLWIMELSAPAGERRTLLAEPPVRPAASIETLTLLRGPMLSKAPKTPEGRIRNLYPQLSDVEVERFVEALRAKGDLEQGIKVLEEELDGLRATLNAWEENQFPDGDSDDSSALDDRFDFLQNGGSFIKERLLDCFQRKSQGFEGGDNHPDGGYTLNLSSDLLGPDLDRWWEDLRDYPAMEKYLDQISTLHLDNARFTPDTEGLLSDFANLRKLSIVSSGLTEVPPGIGKMHALESLSLTDNNIRLTADSADPWKDLSRLKTLRLDGNPLSHPPDVSALPNLTVLRLANTGLEDWPAGLVSDSAGAKRRPRDFYLDLRDCPIKNLPEVTAGSDQAFIVARARMSTTALSAADKIRFGDYRESVGLAREQVFLPAAADEIRHWPQAPDDQRSVFSPSAKYTLDREEFWQDLMAEPGSGDFFKVIRQQRQTADFQNAEARRQLTSRVWQMIEAAALDTELRQELFERAREPQTCADAGAQRFNNMGLRVLVARAPIESANAVQLESTLVKLARGAARLEIVGDIAREEIISQRKAHQADPLKNPPDDIVVHLAFETGLGERLDLPWHSDRQLYRPRSGVTDAKIDTAFETVIDREKGDGLANRMLGLVEVPFWDHYLRTIYPAEFAENYRVFEQKLEWLEDLRDAQKEWATTKNVKDLGPLKRKMEDLAGKLNVAQSEVFSGEEMSKENYDHRVSELGYQRDDLARRLTREALARAGL
ncbi:NEL-type E3 ubiquitin ligase domain-containing protein [Pseudomonas sp. TMB3-21]